MNNGPSPLPTSQSLNSPVEKLTNLIDKTMTTIEGCDAYGTKFSTRIMTYEVFGNLLRVALPSKNRVKAPLPDLSILLIGVNFWQHYTFCDWISNTRK